MINIDHHYQQLATQYSYLHPLRNEVVQDLAQLTTPFHTIVDMGCGDGSLLSAVKQQINHPDKQFIGVDQSGEMCQLTRKRGLQTIQATFDNLRFHQFSKSIVVFHESIHHATDLSDLAVQLYNSDVQAICIYYQMDWWLAPTNDILDEYINLARNKRTGFDSIRNHLQAAGWQINDEIIIQSKNVVSADYPKIALEQCALSYWNTVPEAKRKLDIGALPNSNYTLNRVLKRVLFQR